MYEAQVHEELSQLVGDSGALHKFLEAALRLESHAFESALGPVSPSLVHLTEGSPSMLVSPPRSPSPSVKCCRWEFNVSEVFQSNVYSNLRWGIRGDRVNGRRGWRGVLHFVGI